MSTNATTLLLPRRWGRAHAPSVAERSAAGGWRELPGVVLLVAIVAVSLMIVIVAADRPTFLIPPTIQHYFPHWLAGPLGGLLPRFSRSTSALNYLFTYGLVGMYGAYMLVLMLVGNVRARWVIGAVLAVHLVLFLSPPLALTDVFNYLNYGRMEIVHHLNPYATIPILEPHDDPAYAMSNWHHLLSPYGPMFTIVTFALVPLGVAASFWVMKGILMLSSLGTLVLVWHCARLLGRDPVRAVAFVGLNPVVLMWGLGGDHNDFITIFFIMLAFYLLLRSRAAGAGALLREAQTRDGEQSDVPTSPTGDSSGPALADRPAVTPVVAVAGAPLLAGEPSVVTHVSRRALATWLARAVEVAAARAATLRARPSSAVGAAAAPPTDRPSEGAEVQEPAPDRPLHPAPAGDRVTARRAVLRGALWPELGAGVALIVAVSMKASAAILIPVVLLGLAWSRRRMANLALGMFVAAILAGVAAYVAFGAHIPDLSTQNKLITAESLPNLLGLVLGQGGETVTLHAIIQGVLVLSVLAASWWAWRRREFVTPAAWATVALLATLSWVLPWYVLWLLPLAALAGSRALQRVALTFGVYLILVWAPLAGSWYAAIHFAPTKTALGQAHQRETKLLLH